MQSDRWYLKFLLSVFPMSAALADLMAVPRLRSTPMSVKAVEYGRHPEDMYIHSVVPIHGHDGNLTERLFIYTEKA